MSPLLYIFCICILIFLTGKNSEIIKICFFSDYIKGQIYCRRREVEWGINSPPPKKEVNFKVEVYFILTVLCTSKGMQKLALYFLGLCRSATCLTPP